MPRNKIRETEMKAKQEYDKIQLKLKIESDEL